MAEREKTSPYTFRYRPKQHKTAEDFLLEFEGDLGGVMTENTLSEEQRGVFSKVRGWLDGRLDERLLTLGGFAGSGKSTMVSVLAGHYSLRNIAYGAYTGKAASVLRKKFVEAHVSIIGKDISTLHSLMYNPLTDRDTGIVSAWQRKEDLDYDLIVVDEASMVDERLFTDLRAYDIPILAVGDHGQLPPIYGDFNLMAKPDLRLDHIHRQAEHSPILALSAFVRRTGQVPRGSGDTVEVQVLELNQLPDVVMGIFNPKSGVRVNDVGLLTFTNRERVELNRMVRDARGGVSTESLEKDIPIVGDQVICLRNVDGHIFNGMRGIITDLKRSAETVHHYYGTVYFEEEEIEVEGHICKAQFGRENTFKDFNEYHSATGLNIRNWDSAGLLFDFGFALTVHKAQGSQWEHVIVVNTVPRSFSFDLKKRALYTAITRCSKYLVVLQ